MNGDAGAVPGVAAGHLRDALAERAAARGLAPPAVAVLGSWNVLSGADPHRRDARVHLTPAAVLVGPRATGPAGVRACGHCLGTRWQRLRTRTERDALETGSDLTAVGVWPVLPAYLVEAAWQLYETVVLGPTGPRPWPDDPNGARLPVVSSVDLRSLAVRTVPVLPDPRCPSCARPVADGRDEAVVRPQPRPKPTANSYRLRSPGSYPMPTAALVNPVCGMLGAGTAMNITSPTTAPVTGSVFVRGYGGLLDVSWSGQANSFADSRHLALLEGLERYAGTHRRRNAEPVVAALRDIAADALDPATCGLYPPHVYARDPMVAPFSPDAAIPWVWGYSLRDERPVLVPRRLCHYSSGASSDNFVLSSSSGCATGSCVEEAMLYGLLELVERDAFLLGWYGNATLPRIDLSSCDSTLVRSMVDRAEAQGYQVHAFDNRIDLGVPVVTSLAVRRDGGLGTLSFAAAAHLDPVSAVEGSLAEALTYLPHQARTATTRRAELEAMADDYGLVHQLADHSALFGLPRMAHHAASYVDTPVVRGMGDLYARWEATRPGSLDLRDDLRGCLSELTGAGFDVVVVDQTTPEQETIGLHSVCMIVPGLIPIDFGWHRQRALYLPRMRTALRRAGLRDTDLTDADLRLVPHPFP
jgi:ribosomal protein S12 methylthiotransferase accessory factor